MTAFEADIYRNAAGACLHYRVHRPANPGAPSPYPLVLFLHGAGERGADNVSQLVHAVPDLLAYTVKHGMPATIVAPQCPLDDQWVATPWSALSHTMPGAPSLPMALVIELLIHTIETGPVDADRVYVTGISMGGFGVWDMIQRRPELFAAALPVCGGGDTAAASKLIELPIWAFHGGRDRVVHPVRSRDMIAAIREAGGSPRYTEYAKVAHDSWSATYANDDVLNWLFRQRRVR